MSNQFDVVALGELLIDFTVNGESAQGNSIFEANPGGAPCNVLAMLRKLHKTCAFIGKVGDDMFGRLLRVVGEEADINMDSLLIDRDVRTTLAFVQTLAGGDRDFSFYRNPGADMMLRADELPMERIGNAKIFHFGTLSMTHEGVREATIKAVETAKRGGAVISFDPNLRPPLWESMEEAKAQISWGLAHSDVVKIADNEVEFMTGETDFDHGAASLHRDYPNLKLLNITAGADGSYAYYEDKRCYVPGVKLGGTIETTGAGDTFCACVLNFVLKRGLEGLTETDLTDMLRFANTAAYLVTTKKGAIRSMPEKEQVEELIKSYW